MSKAETLANGLHNLAHRGELDMHGLIHIAPTLGLERNGIHHGIYDEEAESDASYFARIHEYLRSPEGLKEMEEHYDTLSADMRREIGRTINRVRRR